MDHTERLMEWIKEGEHETQDFKLAVKQPDKIAKNIVAFANTSGGTILVGISDFGEIVGVDPEQEIYIINKAAREYCDPPVKIKYQTYESEGLTVLAATVKKSNVSDHAAIDKEGNRRVWVREFDECVSDGKKLQERERLEAESEPVPIFTNDNSGLVNYLKIHHTITIDQYMRLMDLPYALAKKSLDRMYHTGVLSRSGKKDSRYYSLNT
jgi:predicted HTH transcriptional regulator